MMIFNSRHSVGPAIHRRRWPFCALAAAVLLFGTAMCEASSSVVVTAENFWSGQALYPPSSNPVEATACGQQTVSAAPEVVVGGTTYLFLFWNINAAPYASQVVKFSPLCGAANAAVAVYLPTGGCAATVPCPPPTTDAVVAYSLNASKVIPNQTPISSASSGWVPGSTEVTPPTTIEALPEIIPYGKFKGWNIAGTTSITTSTSLTLGSPGAIVIGLYGYPDPDPCQTIRNEISDPAVCDGLTAKACSALMSTLNKQLTSCEASYGE